jgi:hypothetical protein
LPPAPATAGQPVDQVALPEPLDHSRAAELEVIEDSVDEELAVEDQLVVDEESAAVVEVEDDIDDVVVGDDPDGLEIDDTADDVADSPSPPSLRGSRSQRHPNQPLSRSRSTGSPQSQI